MAEKADDKAEKKGKVEVEVRPKKVIPWRAIALGLFFTVNLGATGGGAALVYLSTIGFHHTPITEKTEKAKLDANAKEEESTPILFTMDPFTVNLNGVPRRVIRVVMTFELLDQKGFEELVNLGPQPKDEIVRLFNGKYFADLESIQGKLYVKDQIASILTKQMKDGVIKNVYFNESVVQ